jgi:DeoR family transcriptional regulator, suf operon transcriptional repressor
MHLNQKRILDFLLENRKGASLEEIAAHLGLSKTGTKEHLRKVEASGFLTFEDTRGAVGRPRRRYFLSDTSHDAFPKQYSWLASVLLELLAEDLGDEKVSRIMSDLADKVASSMMPKFDAATKSADRLALVASALSDLGYRATLRQSDLRKGAVIEATNCVYHDVAKRHPDLCRFDVRFIERATGGMNVTLEKCIARGADVCRFCIKKA